MFPQGPLGQFPSSVFAVFVVLFLTLSLYFLDAGRPARTHISGILNDPDRLQTETLTPTLVFFRRQISQPAGPMPDPTAPRVAADPPAHATGWTSSFSSAMLGAFHHPLRAADGDGGPHREEKKTEWKGRAEE